MTNRQWCARAAVFILTVFLLSTPCLADDTGMEKVGAYGYIDWVGEKVIAKGTGAPPKKYFGKPQARPMAMRAATADARRNLLEVIKGVHIDAKTTVQNRLTYDDTIITKVEGLIRASTVDDIQYMSDGTIEATVSMPMSGQLGEILLRQTVELPGVAGHGAPPPEGGVEVRLQRLEQRVSDLESRLQRMGNVALEQQEMIRVMGAFVASWVDYAAMRPQIIRAAAADMPSLTGLEQKVVQQEMQLSALTRQLDTLADRLAAVEKMSDGEKAAPQKAVVPYTGLVIDARGTGFKPCLKPGVYGPGKQIYPGGYVDKARAVKQGFIRYYRDVTRAQQSSRIGTLPLTIKATGTYDGQRNLAIGPEDFDTLTGIVTVPGSFMAQCNVVIVF